MEEVEKEPGMRIRIGDIFGGDGDQSRRVFGWEGDLGVRDLHGGCCIWRELESSLLLTMSRAFQYMTDVIYLELYESDIEGSYNVLWS
jgi:hypothetical protein